MCSSFLSQSAVLPQLTILSLLLILLIPHFPSAHCLNLDTRFPVTFHYPGRGNSYSTVPPHFGHSVLHFQSATDRSPDSTVFLIGAPNESGIERNGSGAVYRCEWREKLDRTSCYRVQINFDYRSGPTEGMHLGSNLLVNPQVSTTSPTSSYISCAYARTSQHNIFRPSLNRYEMNYNPNGACYQLSLDRPRPLASLMPADDGSLQFKSHNATSSVYYYSHAMAGFSAAFAHNGSHLYLGAPGFDNWRGALMAVPESAADGVLRLPTGDQKSATLIQGKVDEDGTQSELSAEFAYLGYSVAIGRFFKQEEEVAAVGAPRVAFIGSVAFFRLNSNQNNNANRNNQQQQQSPIHQLRGTQSGEYFGASLLAIDLNGDGLSDLLVGAPMYCSPGKKDVSDEGRVYVFISTEAGSLVQRQTLAGNRASDSRFGTAIATAGDLNHDGFEDVVVGAPYEDAGQGAVYLYRGGPRGELLLSGNYSQRIAASQVSSSGQQHRLLGFGFSFGSSGAPPLDVDGNGWADLLVGAYLSDSAVLLRTRPLIGLSAAIHLSNDSIDLSAKCPTTQSSNASPSSSACISLQLCFNTANFEAGNRVRLRTYLQVDALMANGAERCYLLNGQQQRSTSAVDTIDLVRSPLVPICTARPYLVVMEEQAQIDNYLAPVQFSMRYELDSGSGSQQALTRENIYSVPVVEGATVNITTQAYLRACGRKAAKDCLSSLQLRPYVILQQEGQQSEKEDEEGEEREAEGVIELIEGLHTKVRLQLLVLNVGEPAFDVKLNLTVNSDQLSLISIDSRCTVSTSSSNGTTRIECSLGSGPLTDRASPVELTFAPFTSYRLIGCTVQISAANRVEPTSSHMVQHFAFRRVKRAGISLQVLESPPPIRYKSGSANVSFSSLLTLERLNYSTIDLLELHFVYPGGRRLLTDPMLITNLNNRIKMKCDDEKDYSLQQQELKRIQQKIRISSSKSLSLNCDPTTISRLQLHCKAIRCRLGPMSWQALSAYVKFSSGLQLATIEEDLIGSHQVEQIEYAVHLRATIVDEHLESSSSASAVSTSSVATIQLTFKSVEPVTEQPVAWWIYLLGVLIGLLLIALLVLILCKCGFFKRRGAAALAAQEEQQFGEYE